jgi:hypothetical protein
LLFNVSLLLGDLLKVVTSDVCLCIDTAALVLGRISETFRRRLAGQRSTSGEEQPILQLPGKENARVNLNLL